MKNRIFDTHHFLSTICSPYMFAKHDWIMLIFVEERQMLKANNTGFCKQNVFKIWIDYSKKSLYYSFLWAGLNYLKVAVPEQGGSLLQHY